MVQLLAYDRNYDKWVNLDIQEDITISLNKSIEEIQDITQRKTSYTKTFTIPSSDVNEKFFRSAFNVNATNFNNKLQTDCVIQNGGDDLFNGRMRLNKIIMSPVGAQYEVYLVQEVSPFSSELKNFNICQMDFDDIAHDVDYDNIVSTWSFSGGSYLDYTGITGSVLYPITLNGYDNSIPYGKLDLSSNGFTNSSFPLTIDQFKPWLNLKYMVDKIFDTAGFTYNSEFFDTEYFKTQFVLAGNNNAMGTAIIGDRPDNQNKFLVSYEGDAYSYQAPSPLSNWQYIVFNTVDYDYLDIYRESGFPATGPNTGYNWFTVPITGAYQFLIKQDIYIVGASYGPTYLNIQLRNIDTGAVKSVQSGVTVAPGGATTYTFYMNATLTKGERIALTFTRQTGGGFPTNTIGFRQNTSSFELYSSPDVVTSLGDIKVDDNLPCNITGLDFIQDLVGLFNLVIIPNGDRSFLIEPWTNYLSSSSGTTYDWSDKLDYDSSYEIEPLDFDLQRQIRLTYTPADDQLNDYYQNQYSTTFGEKTFIKQSDLLTGAQELEFKFEPLPTNSIAAGTSMVIPYLNDFDGNQSPAQVPRSSGLRLGFFCGMQHFYTNPTATTPTNYYILSGTTSIAHDTYPVVNHLSLLQEQQPFLEYAMSDLNLNTMYDFFQADDVFAGYTDNNLFNTWYKPYINGIYSDEARLFTGKFILTPEEVSKLDFNDSVYFLNARWRLYSVNDADITQQSLVECQFLKEPFRGGKVDPIGPDYVAQNTERTPPGPIPTNDLYWYVDNNLGSLSGNVGSLLFEVYQGLIEYVSETTTGSGVQAIPSGDNFYNFSIDFNFSSGSMNNLRLCLGTTPGGCSIAQLDIPQPAAQTYNIQATQYFPASGNIYATISTY